MSKSEIWNGDDEQVNNCVNNNIVTFLYPERVAINLTVKDSHLLKKSTSYVTTVEGYGKLHHSEWKTESEW